MAKQLFMKKQNGRLIPSGTDDSDILSSVPNNKELKITISQPRNLRHLRKMFALLQLVLENQPEPPAFLTIDDLLECLKIAVGHSRKMQHNGLNIVVPKSIAFDSLDQHGFESFYDAIVGVILKTILPNMSRGDLDKQVYEILDGRKYA